MQGVNLPQLLVQLRQCRMGVIQTAQQLRYSYLAVVEGGKLLLATPPDERAALEVSRSTSLRFHVPWTTYGTGSVGYSLCWLHCLFP